jgi:multiple antibiotic resistance protein
MDHFWNAFLPIFVAVDGIGLIPMFWGLTQRLTVVQRRLALSQAVGTALGVAVVFLFISRWVFALMGLQLADVMVGGGLILIVLCFRDLLLPEEHPHGQYPNPGVTPLGVPLMTGPAVLTAALLVRQRYGWPLTLVSLGVNMLVVWLILRCSEWLMQRLGQEGAQVISKIFSLILTAFGVMLVRQGLAMLQPGGGG